MRRSTWWPPSLRPIALAAVGAALALSACSSDTDDSEPTASGSESSAPIVQPGEPGEAASTIGPDDVPTPPEWNDNDAEFAQMMIPHHGQALEMSRLAMKHASSEQVVALARRIEGTQGPEIVAMATWLEQRGLEVPTAKDQPDDSDHGDHGDHDQSSMTGMLTEAEMVELERARGARFDRLFLEGMVRHHRGAVQMAESVGRDGSDVLITEMAADVTAVQTAEIARMRQMLRGL